MNMLDIIVIGIFGICIVKGFNQGFFKTLYKTFWIFIVWFLYPYVNGMFLKTSFAKNLNIFLGSYLNLDGLENLSYLKTLQDLKILNISQLEEGIINIVFMAVTFLIISLIINIGMSIAYNTAKILLKFPPLNLTNKIAGILIGAVSGFFNSLLFIVLVFTLSMFDSLSFLKTMLDGAIVSNVMDSDVVLNFILRTVDYYEKIF